MNLFVYGTLMNESTQKIVAGKSFRHEKAVLRDFRKVTSATCFPFIIPYRGLEVEGYILFGIDEVSMARMDKYEAEGDLYWRRTVQAYLYSDNLPVECEVYIGNVKSIKKYFMPGTDIDDRIELYVETELDELLLQDSLKNIDFFHAVEQTRITKELLGSAFDEVVQTHISHQGISLSFLTRNLQKAGIPTLRHIRNNTEILPYADNYISFAVRHIIFNQIEEKIHDDFRGAVKVKNEFYSYAISVMLALEFINTNSAQVSSLMAKNLADKFHEHWEYVDYADVAIKIADTIYDRNKIEVMINNVKANRNVGEIPLGAEVEFSTVGRYAVHPERPPDPEYNYFKYFRDFDLTRRLWKLGGHVDDHRFPDPMSYRSYGFLEYAFGRTSIYADTSKPVTLDPWVLNRLINQASVFSGVRPHSLHISIQARDNVPYGEKNKIEHLICLLLMGGDLGFDSFNKLREKRIYNREIIDSNNMLHFSSENVHYQDTEKQLSKTVIEFQFPRLYLDFNYEPLIMALKGYQLAQNPRPLISALNPEKNAVDEMEALRQWAQTPYPLSEGDIDEFIEMITDGLMAERDGEPAHKITYIRKNIAMVSARIKAKNKFVESNCEK